MTPLVIAAVKAASTMSTTAKLWCGLKEGVTVVAEAAETLNKGKEVVNTGAEVYHWLTDKKEESAKAENSIDGVEVEIDEDQSFFAIPNQTLQAALDKFKEEAPVN